MSYRINREDYFNERGESKILDENGKEMMNNNIIASAIYQKLCNNHKAHLFGDVVICHTSRVY